MNPSRKYSPVIVAAACAAFLLPASAYASPPEDKGITNPVAVAAVSSNPVAAEATSKHGPKDNLTVGQMYKGEEFLVKLPSGFVGSEPALYGEELHYYWESAPMGEEDFAFISILEVESDQDLATTILELNEGFDDFVLSPTYVKGAEEAYTFVGLGEFPEGMEYESVFARDGDMVVGMIVAGTSLAWETYDLDRTVDSFRMV